MQADNLSYKHCVPCEGGVKPFTEKEYAPLLSQVKQWKVIHGKAIEKEFKKKNFKEALACINTIGNIAEEEGHHPDLFLHDWNKIRVSLTTHAIGGLSENDFILAAKIDEIAA